MCVCGVFMLRINSTTRWPSVTTIQCAFTINSGEILSRVRIRRRNGRVSLLWRALKKRSLAHNMQKQIKATTYYWTTTGPKPVVNNMSNNVYGCLEGLPEPSIQYSQIARIANANENRLFHFPLRKTSGEFGNAPTSTME